ncbi:MAG: hypothetical protein R3Y21_02045 [Mycoplasmatota bacterium]
MREAIANASIFNIMMVFIGVIIALLVGSLSYTKAFKVKNGIIEFIENTDSGYSANQSTVEEQIESFLIDIGYRVNSNGINNCPTVSGATNGGAALNPNSNYQYCIYGFESSRGMYYKVVAYMYFDFPIISSLLTIPVSGETIIFYYAD